MMLWELRYRSPRAVDNVQIETIGETEEEAKALAEAYLATLSSPAIRFIYVRRIVVARSKDYPAIVAAYGQPRPAAPPARSGADVDRIPSMSGEVIGSAPAPLGDGSADGLDDGMSGPRVAEPTLRGGARAGKSNPPAPARVGT
jgi:hypothetical protein